MNDFSKVRITGRCLEDGGILWLTFSLSEVSFLLKGAAGLAFTMVTNDPEGDPARLKVAPRFKVEVDGNEVLDQRLTTGEARISVPIPKGREEVTVRLVKLSECTQSLLGIREIETDGEMIPTPEKRLRIEFIGDSITCGYGVEAESGLETFSTATENAEKGYAGILARKLGAAVHLTAYSGHGIVSGWTGDPAVRNTDLLVPELYEATGSQDHFLPSGRRLREIPWDFNRFQPELILINLGTNDLSWCREVESRKQMFRKAYADFLKQVRRHNPGSVLLCALGLMGTGLNRQMTEAVADYQRETGDRRISAMLLPQQDLEKDGAGADFHPSAATQRKLAKALCEALREIGF